MTQEQERPRLGAFSKPSKPRARQEAEEVLKDRTEPDDEQRKAEEDDLLAQVDDGGKGSDVEKEAKERMSLYQEMQQALLPVEDYQAFLKEHNISEDEAEEIVDNLLTKGYHEETIPISKRRTVTFRTREHRDLLRLQAVFNVQQLLYQGAVDEMTVRYNMAASLREVNDQKFEFPTATTKDEDADKLFDKRMEFVERMPSPLFSKLSVKLANFDRKIAAVMREGVAENF